MCSQPGGALDIYHPRGLPRHGLPRCIRTTPTLPKERVPVLCFWLNEPRARDETGAQHTRSICIIQSEMHFLLVTYLPDGVQQLQWIFSATKHSLVLVANGEFLIQTENPDKKLCKTVLQKFSLLIHPREATF